MSEKRGPEVPTVPDPNGLNAVQVLSGLISKLQTTVDNMRTDVCDHLHRMEETDKRLANRVEELSGAHRKFEMQLNKTRDEVATLRSKIREEVEGHRADRQHISNLDLEHEAAMGAAIAHVSRLEQELADMREQMAQAHRERGRQSEALGAIVDELGIHDRVQLGKTVPPGTDKPKSALTKMSRAQKGGIVASVATGVVVVVQLVLEVLHRLGK